MKIFFLVLLYSFGANAWSAEKRLALIDRYVQTIGQAGVEETTLVEDLIEAFTLSQECSSEINTYLAMKCTQKAFAMKCAVSKTEHSGKCTVRADLTAVIVGEKSSLLDQHQMVNVKNSGKNLDKRVKQLIRELKKNRIVWNGVDMLDGHCRKQKSYHGCVALHLLIGR